MSADLSTGAVSLALTVLLLPLVGAAVIAVFGPYFHRAGAAAVGCASVFLAFVGTVMLAFEYWHGGQATQAVLSAPLGAWAHIPPLTITFGLLVDPLALVWMLVVTGVGFLIHLYSVGYMAEAKNYRTFFSYMNLFVFTMLLLVMSDSFLWLLVGWGGVGLASYLLIGFDWERPAAVLAARKALIMNVIGDVGIMIALFLMYAHVHSVSYANVFANVTSIGASALTWIGVWLLVGAVAKSAQLPLHTWLPDAMEGPTPVSALIHAATMVTAGVYLVARAHPIYDHAPVAAGLVAAVGALSALFAATIGCVQYDIKRVLAYSTMSQIGYMVFAVGIGAYSAGAFHFITHAFFKALLFMSAGIVIHNLAGEQDIRKMGGLAKKMPLAFWTFLIGTLAISGIPPFAGFFSKDAIIDQAQRLHHPVLGAMATLAALLTAFYMFRLLLLTFFTGPYRGEAPIDDGAGASMKVPVIVLAALSIVGGWLVLPGRDALSPALQATFADMARPLSMAEFSWLSALATLLLVVAGVLTAYAIYVVQPSARQWVRNRFGAARAELMNAYYVDATYHWLFERPAYWLANTAAAILDPEIFSGLPGDIARAATRLGEVPRAWESGQLRRYGLSIALGVVALLVYYIFAAHFGAALGAR
ncbi:MAG: NADH-quinone oxidoreductase subunit L [Candidatus Eremiobacteraeota bacterium]|nr:NADH-quinone oxidoreductase subunit L [Candidatus Eremiobacteraeota bacterium]